MNSTTISVDVLDPQNLDKDTEFIQFRCHGNKGRSWNLTDIVG